MFHHLAQPILLNFYHHGHNWADSKIQKLCLTGPNPQTEITRHVQGDTSRCLQPPVDMLYMLVLTMVMSKDESTN